MSAGRRVQGEPAWLLHHRPFRDSSRILDVLSRDHGRLSLVARGSRSAKSRLKGILRPFLPLSLSWVMRTDLGTLTGAEMNGAPIALSGDALLSGYYLNELILNLLHRHDPQPEIFSAYEAAINRLAGRDEVAADLRCFEMDMLAMLGYALNLDHDTNSGGALAMDATYEYHVDRGPVAVEAVKAGLCFTGAELTAIGRQEFDNPTTLRNAGRLMKTVIAWHLAGKELKSRKVMREIRRGTESQG